MSDLNGSHTETEAENDDDSEDGSEDESCDLVLIFTSDGHAVLEEENEAVWFSDDDDDFRENIEDEFLEADLDAGKVLNYLVEEGLIDEDEKGNVEIEQEELDEEE